MLARTLISYRFNLTSSKCCLWALLFCMAGLINKHWFRLCLLKSKTQPTKLTNLTRVVNLMKTRIFLVCQHINKTIWLIKFSSFQRTVLVLGRAIVSQLLGWRHRLQTYCLPPKQEDFEPVFRVHASPVLFIQMSGWTSLHST